MKKVFISTLMLVSLMGLTACGDNGLVKNGQAYRDGDAAKVSAEVKEAKEGKIKSVTEKATAEIVLKETALGQSYTTKQKSTGIATADFDAKTFSYNYKATASAQGQSISQTIDFKAKQENDGSFSLVSGNFGGGLDSDSVALLYEELSFTIYSWNYTGDSESLAEGLAMLGSSEEGTEAAVKLYEDLSKVIVIAGDPSTGNIEIGIEKAAKFTIAGLPVELNKMKYVYKDGLLQNSVNDMKITVVDEGGTSSFSMKSSASFSYVMK